MVCLFIKGMTATTIRKRTKEELLYLQDVDVTLPEKNTCHTRGRRKYKKKDKAVINLKDPVIYCILTITIY